MNNSEKILEFDKIKKMWAECAVMDSTKEKIQNVKPYLDESELCYNQKQTTEARNMIEKCGIPSIPSFSDVEDIMEIAKKECCLSAEELEKIGYALVAVRRLKDYLNRCKVYEFSLSYYEEELEDCDEIKDMIQQQIHNGNIDDRASETLFSIRREIDTLNEKMRKKVDQIIRSNKNYITDSFSTLRNNHICIPVKKEYRNKISGTVMDKSATGSTVFIEPTSVSKCFDEIQSLKIDEENEELCIRYTLTAMLLDSIEVIMKNITIIEKLDFAFSKGKLSLEYNGVQPDINTNRIICLEEARHPLLDKEKCIPLNLNIGNGINGIIITGPNTGGKTVAIKTVALCCMMSQCGLHIPCKSANVCMNSNYLCDIGDGQNLSENLSTFSAHLKNILSILNSINEESLIVLDELGSGTDPTEGMGIAISVLTELKKSNALFLVTTHYPQIKQFANDEKTIINARMDFDKETLTPLYKLIIGESGESCAFSIAKRLGMSSSMLKTASMAAYGDDYEKHISKLYDSNKSLVFEKNYIPKIIKKKTHKPLGNNPASKFKLGDSVTVYPDKKIGIICKTADKKGILGVQLKGKKIFINHKRVK
ncbi:MAG: DNA mismatch repair protein MutS, partial [Acutalibacteraceae bacterium]|nr:DNA mismatch repair protein MutS [Acutalibacteraceae bacterium]